MPIYNSGHLKALYKKKKAFTFNHTCIPINLKAFSFSNPSRLHQAIGFLFQILFDKCKKKKFIYVIYKS